MITFQEMIAKLTAFWAERGCLVHQGYDLEVGAGTFNPVTFLRCLGPEPYSAVYVEPSRRPQDGRYGENPNRLQFYHQMQVILKPSPENIQDLYLDSLAAIGLNLSEHDIRFVHDDWENPTIGAWGLGWEVWADGMEVSQFTYFQAVGGLPVKPVTGELTYGLERLALYIQNVDSFFDLKWNDTVTYGEVYQRSEWEWSHYNFSEARVEMWLRHFEDFEAEAYRLIERGFPIPAYDFVIKASHSFNILDARGVISVTERTGYISRIRNLAKKLAESYLESREKQNFPLLKHHKKRPLVASLPPSTAGSPQEKATFLLEIGSEEMPATFVPIGMQQLEKNIRSLLDQNGLAYEAIKTFGTPRRIAVQVEGLVGAGETLLIEKKGPALSKAFDNQGELTPAGKGFLHSLHLPMATLAEIKDGKVEGIEVQEIKGELYLFARTQKEGVKTRELLSSHLPELILKLEFPKKMRWSDLEIEYARPLRWMVALYGKESLPFTLGSLSSSHISYGHRQLANHAVELKEADEYVQALKKASVLVDVKERKESILSQIAQIEKELDAVAFAKERVLPQVLNLVEWPFVTVGSFDPKFLHAPKEVLASEMIEHQKYFPIEKAGELLPHFLIVCNNQPTDLIRQGNRKALSPRLADGVFLYEEDLKVPLEQLNQKLRSMIFQKELGSVWAKVERLIQLVKLLHPYLPKADLTLSVRAATLCKADLASELVGEFPELQGVVGKLYAEKQGEEPAVATAIEEHWMPRGERAPLPQTPSGQLVSLAEKFDNFLSCYALGLKPTSSSDPYALRRQGLGILKILIDSKTHLPLPRVLNAAFHHFLEARELSADLKEQIKTHSSTYVEEILSFLTARFRSLLQDEGFEKDAIEAVLVKGLDDPFDLLKKLQALAKFRKEKPELFLHNHEIHTRTKKILLSQNRNLYPEWQAQMLGLEHSQSHRFPKVDPSLLQVKAENELYHQLSQLKELFHKKLIDRRAAEERNWEQAFIELARLQQPLSNLFEEVKIIDDDLTTRMNRLGLLQEVWDLSEELLDFEKIQL